MQNLFQKPSKISYIPTFKVKYLRKCFQGQPPVRTQPFKEDHDHDLQGRRPDIKINDDHFIRIKDHRHMKYLL